jgi:hypothetical protein
MPQTPRELVYRALKFEGPERMPRQTWVLPWAEKHFPNPLAELRRRYPDDITYPPMPYRTSPKAKGDPYAVGTSVDEWGCVFTNITAGIIGEVKQPILADLGDVSAYQPPYEVLPADTAENRDIVRKFYDSTDRFVIAGCPRPWERMQFLRGTENAMLDVMSPEDGGGELLRKIHEYYLRECEFMVKTSVDAIIFMDDWGSQKQLLIPPAIWRELFKPLYKDYCDLAHAHGKFAFMHSDGHIQEIYPDLIEVGVDAVNSQLFVMDFEELGRCAKGKITFWGEIDRQHILTASDPDVARRAVRKVAKHLYDPRGGIIAQFELGLGANPDNAFAVYDEWDRIHAENARA